MLLFATSIYENIFTNQEKVVDLLNVWQYFGVGIVVVRKTQIITISNQCYTIYKSNNEEKKSHLRAYSHNSQPEPVFDVK